MDNGEPCRVGFLPMAGFEGRSSGGSPSTRRRWEPPRIVRLDPSGRTGAGTGSGLEGGKFTDTYEHAGTTTGGGGMGGMYALGGPS